MPLLANDPHLGRSICRASGTRSASSAAMVHRMPAVRRRRLRLLGRAGRRSSATTTASRGASRTSPPTSPTSTSRRSRATRYWRDGALVPARRAHRDDRGRRRRRRRARASAPPCTARSSRASPTTSPRSPRTRTPAPAGVVAAPADAPEGEYAVSLRWTALRAGHDRGIAIFALNLAQDFDDFRAAAALFDVPAQNLVYADVDGNIGYQTPGKLPIRGAGDGSMPQPGWDSAYDWQGFIPFDELPVVVQPRRGLHRHREQRDRRPTTTRTSSRATGTTAGAPRASSTCSSAQSANGKLTADDMRDIQADNEFCDGQAPGRGVRRDRDRATRSRMPRSTCCARGTRRTSADSAAAAYANVLWDELVQRPLRDRARGRRSPLERSGAPVPRRRRSARRPRLRRGGPTTSSA